MSFPLTPVTPEASRAVLQAARELAGSKSLIAFTGAGISVESGIPPFRGEGGIWTRYDPETLELGRFLRDPAAAWPAIREIFYEYTSKAEPNDAHRVLARWEAEGRLAFLITQNIDGLHEAAGSRALAEFHGSCRHLVCLACGARVEAEPALLADLPPRCRCGGIYKPGFVFFGEGIPREAYEASFAAAEAADACLVIGSTGEVYPAAEIPRIVKRRGGLVVEIDPEPTGFTESVTDIFIRAGASEAMRKLDAAVRQP
ncbi:MAG: NAD-dependent protein deacylase [Treponema sp.]|nr:NAD-dependent protein deacylase [Treponema sp.]